MSGLQQAVKRYNTEVTDDTPENNQESLSALTDIKELAKDENRSWSRHHFHNAIQKLNNTEKQPLRTAVEKKIKAQFWENEPLYQQLISVTRAKGKFWYKENPSDNTYKTLPKNSDIRWRYNLLSMYGNMNGDPKVFLEEAKTILKTILWKQEDHETHATPSHNQAEQTTDNANMTDTTPETTTSPESKEILDNIDTYRTEYMQTTNNQKKDLCSEYARTRLLSTWIAQNHITKTDISWKARQMGKKMTRHNTHTEKPIDQNNIDTAPHWSILTLQYENSTHKDNGVTHMITKWHDGKRHDSFGSRTREVTPTLQNDNSGRKYITIEGNKYYVDVQVTLDDDGKVDNNKTTPQLLHANAPTNTLSYEIKTLKSFTSNQTDWTKLSTFAEAKDFLAWQIVHKHKHIPKYLAYTLISLACKEAKVTDLHDLQTKQQSISIKIPWEKKQAEESVGDIAQDAFTWRDRRDRFFWPREDSQEAIENSNYDPSTKRMLAVIGYHEGKWDKARAEDMLVKWINTPITSWNDLSWWNFLRTYVTTKNSQTAQDIEQFLQWIKNYIPDQVQNIGQYALYGTPIWPFLWGKKGIDRAIQKMWWEEKTLNFIERRENHHPTLTIGHYQLSLWNIATALYTNTDLKKKAQKSWIQFNHQSEQEFLASIQKTAWKEWDNRAAFETFINKFMNNVDLQTDIAAQCLKNSQERELQTMRTLNSAQTTPPTQADKELNTIVNHNLGIRKLYKTVFQQHLLAVAEQHTWFEAWFKKNVTQPFKVDGDIGGQTKKLIAFLTSQGYGNIPTRNDRQFTQSAQEQITYRQTQTDENQKKIHYKPYLDYSFFKKHEQDVSLRYGWLYVKNTEITSPQTPDDQKPQEEIV